MKEFRSFVIAALAAATLALLPRGAAAQQAITTDFAGGVAVPSGDVSDAVDLGPAFTVGVNFQVHDMISIRAEGGADFWSGKDDLVATNGVFEGPNITHTRLNAGLVLHAVQPDGDTGAWVDLDAGAGYHILTSERFERQTSGPDVTVIDVSTGYLGAKGGLKVGYKFTDQVSAFAGGDVNLTFADEEDWAEYADLNVDPFSSVMSIPVQAGLTFHFQP